MYDNYSLRNAGHVKRWHTTVTLRQQTVAEHTWQVMRIWFELYGPPSKDVAITILLHDVAEIITGDLPHVVKRDNPRLKAELTRVEGLNQYRMFSHKLPKLSDGNRLRVKLCDLLEMAEFALEEINLGNKGAQAILYNIESAINNFIKDTDECHPDILKVRERLLQIFGEADVLPKNII